MNKQEHINFWSKQVEDDFDAANVLYQAKHFVKSI